MSQRIKFFLSHLSLSVIIATVIAITVFFVWYPAPLYYAADVLPLFAMMLAIDVIVGPILGLLVYKEGKKTLKFDLTVIIILQLLALFYGVYSISQGRPAWIVKESNYFMMVKVSDIEINHSEKNTDPTYHNPSWLGPKFVATKSFPSQTNIVAQLEKQTPTGSHARNPAYYQDIKNIKLKGIAFSVLERYNSEEKIQLVLSKYPEADSWIGLITSDKDMVVLINSQANEVVKIVDLRPWK